MAVHKKRIATFALIAALALFGIVSFVAPSSALAWDNCPKGLVNDPYPGACRRYVDTNGDSICDLSQSEPVASTTTTTQPKATTTTTLAVTTTTSGEPPTGDCPLGPCAGCGACLSISAITVVASADDSTDVETAEYTISDATAAGAVVAAATGSATTSTTTPTSGGTDGSGDTASAGAADSSTANAATVDSGGSSLVTHYNVSPIAIAFFLIYAVSFFLYKSKRIKITVHRKIWNVLLLATFLITGIFGLVLTIQLDYELPFTIPFDLMFWHVEAGVAMTLISLFHIGWHFNYYRNLLRSGRKKIKAVREMESVRETDERQRARQERDLRRRQRESQRGSLPRREFEPEL